MQTPISFFLSFLAIGVALGATGCQSTTAREDATSAIRAVFEDRASRSVAASPRAVAEVVALDPTGIAWKELEGEAGVRTLGFADIISVEWQHLAEFPTRPTTVYLYLDPHSPSVERARAERPNLSSLGVTLPYVELAEREHGAGVRLKRALQAFTMTERAPATPAPVGTEPPAPTSAPPANRLDRIEKRLRVLKRWLDEGLITPEEHAEAKRRLLEVATGGD